MAGTKGHSGRQPRAAETYQLDAIKKCWELVTQAINDESLDFKWRVELAAKHTVKSIPTELTGGLDVALNAMGTITKTVEGASGPQTEHMEFKIGGNSYSPEDTRPSTEATPDNPPV